ncbi:MAG: rhomboid family intramembrane serine protease [Acidobacteria bacterium]|nr:rhomboid family intramembrane serine protease [Acidobacteriota bacterium]
MTTKNRQPPIINAPWPVAGFALVLIGLHLARILLPNGLQNAVFYYGALMPERFWAPAGAFSVTGLPAYSGPVEAFVPMVASALIHSDWMHVILNAAFIVALGKPLLELLRRAWPGREPSASAWLLGLFLFSQIVSSLAYLFSNIPDGGPAIGASGGASGLLAAVLLLREGPGTWLASRRFLVTSAMFVAGNALFAFMGPQLLGASIAWEAHVGGYIGGALFMRGLIWRMQAPAT